MSYYQASQRPFGVEIECYVDAGECRCNYWSNEPCNCPEGISWDSIPVPRGWDLRSDGSLHEGGLEAVSPILMGAKGHRSLLRACRALTGVGATVDSSCGFHVHYDTSDMSRRELLRLVEDWYTSQEQIHSLVSKDRDWSWCDQWKEYELEKLRTNWNEYTQGIFWDDRYKSLNILPSRYGHVEVRCHEGTLDYEEMRAWIRFGQAFIHASKKRKKKMRKVSTAPALIERVKVTPREKSTLYKKLGIQGVA